MRPTPCRRSGLAVLAAASVAWVVVVASCGSSAPDVDDWVAEANLVCTDYQREAARILPAPAGPGLVSAMDQTARLARDEAAALRRLRRPADDEGQVDAWLDALDARALALTRLAGDLRADGGLAIQQLPEDLNVAMGTAGSLAGELGLDICGSGVDLPLPTVPTVPPAIGPGGVLDAEAPAPTSPEGLPTDETTTQDQ